MSAGFRENFSFSMPETTSMSMSRSAASVPAYAMFFISVRSRDSAKASLHSCAKGTPRKVTSWRCSDCVERPRRVVEHLAAGRTSAMSRAYVSAFIATIRS